MAPRAPARLICIELDDQEDTMLDAATKTKSARTLWSRLFRPPRPVRKQWIDITYVGETALTLFGGVSGARYRFGWRGACLPVDIRDATDLLLREDMRVLSAAR